MLRELFYEIGDVCVQFINKKDHNILNYNKSSALPSAHYLFSLMRVIDMLVELLKRNWHTFEYIGSKSKITRQP